MDGLLVVHTPDADAQIGELGIELDGVLMVGSKGGVEFVVVVG